MRINEQACTVRHQPSVFTGKQPHLVTTRQFSALAEGACRILDIEIPDLTLADAAGARALTFDIGTVEITIAIEPGRDPSRLFFFCQLGAIPEERASEILRRLLEANYARLSDDAAILSIDPDVGAVVLEYNVAVSEFTPEALVASLYRTAEIAMKWRESHFLDDRRGSQSSAESVDFA